MEKRVVLITGVSSGFGLEMAKLFLKNGDKVYGLALLENFSLPGLNYFSGDITSRNVVSKVLSRIEKEEGHLDILINNAGYGIFSAIEETPLEEAERIYRVNVLGALNVTQLSLPLLRKGKQSKIINTSSIGSEVPLPFQSFYSAGKCALDTLFDALRSEIRPFGIKIVSLRPGDSKTSFTRNRKTLPCSSLYKERLSRSLKQVEKDEQGGFAPIKVARKALSASKKRNPKQVYRIGGKDRFLNFLFHVLPRKVRSYIVYQIYAK